MPNIINNEYESSKIASKVVFLIISMLITLGIATHSLAIK